MTLVEANGAHTGHSAVHTPQTPGVSPDKAMSGGTMVSRNYLDPA